jgi:predicted HD phosphohydrolase
MVLLKHYVLTMTKQHPITPPPELVQQWVDTYFGGKISQSNFHLDLATRAAQWGADQELEACCTWLNDYMGRLEADDLREARRPGAPSLKEQALEVLERSCFVNQEDGTIIRRALEQLDD